MGPTTAGKTALALELVARFPMEIISVDSALVYRGLDIGTAKPSRTTRERFPHRLVDICEPTESYSAGRFRRDAAAAIDDIRQQGRAPLLVGGTGLYFRALEHGFSQLPGSDPAVRRRLAARLREQGAVALHQQLQQVDPASARRLHPHDSQRIQRALEVHEMTGRPLSELLAPGRREALSGDIVKLALALPTPVIRERAERRFAHMLAAGLVDEVRGFFERKDMHTELPSMRLVGYRQVWRCLEGRGDCREMQERAVIATRQLAKRQMTWLRGERNVTWFDAAKAGVVDDVAAFLEQRGLRRAGCAAS